MAVVNAAVATAAAAAHVTRAVAAPNNDKQMSAQRLRNKKMLAEYKVSVRACVRACVRDAFLLLTHVCTHAV